MRVKKRAVTLVALVLFFVRSRMGHSNTIHLGCCHSSQNTQYPNVQRLDCLFFGRKCWYNGKTLQVVLI